jgi:hypothetical protein
MQAGQRLFGSSWVRLDRQAPFRSEVFTHQEKTLRTLRILQAGVFVLTLSLGGLLVVTSGCDSESAVQPGGTVKENPADMAKGQQATADYYKQQKKK